MDQMGQMYRMHFDVHSQIGHVFVLSHLESEKGKQLNGRRCQVVGSDPFPIGSSSNDSSGRHKNTSTIKYGKALLDRRVHVKVLNADTLQPEGKTITIKPKNMVDPKHCCPVSSRTIPEQETLRRVNLAMDRAIEEGRDKFNPRDDFHDRYFRYKFLKEHLPDHLPPPTKCMDPMVPPDKLGEAALIKEACTPACVGDGFVDFTQFGGGLLGSDDDDCPICHEQLFEGSLRLPCGHMFHAICTKEWLEEHGTCPTCRRELINPWQSYYFDDVGQQIQRRIEEWFLSGMCERCQAAYQENDPLVTVTTADGTNICMPLSAANRRGLRVNQRAQGEGFGECTFVL
jgi:Ring finger domain